MEMFNKFLPAVGLLLVVFIFGFWLRFSGKPYDNALFNIHKLSALAAVVITIRYLRVFLKFVDLRAALLASLTLAALSVMTLFVSGAIMSIGKPAVQLMMVVHPVGVGALSLAIITSILLISPANF